MFLGDDDSVIVQNRLKRVGNGTACPKMAVIFATGRPSLVSCISMSHLYFNIEAGSMRGRARGVGDGKGAGG